MTGIVAKARRVKEKESSAVVVAANEELFILEILIILFG